MTAYVELQEREFALEEHGYTATRHQREVGAGYFDGVLEAVTGGESSTLALEGSTEEAQFAPDGVSGLLETDGRPDAGGARASSRASSASSDRERRELLAARAERQARLDAGERPDFLAETQDVREGDWRVAPAPADLQDRRVEITGPVDRKMMINALNSGARVFMADFEDASSPTWANVVEGQRNVRDAVRRTIALETGEKSYRLNDEIATLVVRPRGWHLPERHVRVDGEPVSASLFDFGLCVFHNARELLERGTGPYFYLPKLESHLEARLWNEAFVLAEDELGLPRGSIRATVLIETILAAFEMEEILYELREHAAALNAGRWDYIFSVIKKLRSRGEVLPGPRAGDDGRAVHARVHRAARPHLPPPRRARDRRHGGVHPVPARRRGQRGRAREGARGQGARGGRRLRRHLGRPPRPRAGRAESSTRCSASGRTSSTGCARTSSGRPPTTCSTSASRAARSPRRGCA